MCDLRTHRLVLLPVSGLVLSLSRLPKHPTKDGEMIGESGISFVFYIGADSCAGSLTVGVGTDFNDDS